MRSCTRRPIARILLAALLAAPAARAEIAGEQVVSGTATFDQSGNITTIHASDGAIINYSQLDVWANEELHFVQPSSESRVLNRVFGDATHIDGGLYANGIVYIVNPAGIFFGPFPIVDVGGLYAAAGDISNEDFLARIDRFTLSGIVESAGSIDSPAVALLGTAVANHGNIHAPDGTIALVAGEKVLLTQLGAHIAVQVEGAGGSAQAPAIEQAGTVDAGAGAVSFTTGDVYSLAINHTGITRGREIELRAESGTVQVAGTLDASDRGAGATGGSIAVTGERVALVGAQLDASGDAGGGEIRVGGDLRGEGALPTARRTYVDEASSLRADAISSGDGGRVIVWADEATAFHGALSARGGAAGGGGGFAEISGAAFLAADGDVDLSAASGATGTLLYDPQDIRLIGGSPVTGDGSDSPDALPGRVAGDTDTAGQILFADVGTLAAPFEIYESEIEGTDANIMLEARNSISTPDADAFVGAVTLLPTRSLTMTTRNDADDATGSSFEPGIHLTGVSFQTTGAAINLSTGDGAIEVGNLTTMGAAGAVDGGAGGAITLTAGDADQSGDSHITTGLLNTSGGDGGTGAGGAGRAVTLRSVGAIEDIPGTTTDPTLGGGSITVAGITTTGGEGGTSAEGGTNGGIGGNVVINTTDGAITAMGAIDTSGGKGDTRGGNAGSINLGTRDANGGTASAHVSTGALIARGGDGGTGFGGSGGAVTVNTRQSIEITVPDDPDVEGDQSQHEDPAGGGDIAITSIATSGGAGGTVGGNAGSVTVQARGEGNVLSVGAITATGGNGSNGNGGRGGNVTLLAQDSNLVIDDPISTRGGNGANTANTALGGSGGNITLTTGIEEDDTGDVLLQALLDASEGTSANTNADALANVDGGTISITSAENIDQTGTAPRIATTGDVSLSAENDIGQATGTLLVKGGDERRLGSNGVFLDEDRLLVTAGGTADVEAVEDGRFLGSLNITATTDAADLHVTQSGGDVIDMTGSAGSDQVVVNRVDTLASEADVQVRFDNLDEDAPDGALVLATGAGAPALTPGAAFDARSDGDVVVGTADGTVIEASAQPDPEDPSAPVTAGTVVIFADQEFDGEGAIRASSDGAVIDMLGDADEPGALFLFATEGIGASGEPITVANGARVGALNFPAIEDPEAEGSFIPDPDATTGIFLRNVSTVPGETSDLTIAASSNDFLGAVVNSGTGEIEITNEAGDLIVTGSVDAKPADLEDEGAGGDVTLAASDSGSEIVLNTGFAIESGGVQTYDGDVVLVRNTSVVADGGVDINGGLDTSDTAATPAGFTATLGDEATDVTTVAVEDGVGAARALGSFAIRVPDGGDVALDTPLVRTTGSQSYDADLELGQQMVFEAGTRIVFDKAGDQSVTASAGGFTLDAGGSTATTPSEATIAKADGNLTLASAGGPVIIGDGDKLSVAGSLAITGSTVRLTDLSALSISVTSPDAQVFARAPGPVATPSGTTIVDGGTDLIANTVAFSSAPSVVGGGPAPRIATPSGSAQNAGALSVGTLPVAISAADIARGSRVFDLAIPAVDPGHETQEIPTAALEPPIEPQPSQDRAGPGAPVSRGEVAEFFACAPVADEAALASCAAAAPPPPYGSALDTERAVEIARAYRELLGDSPDAVAGRASLARAAADPRAEVGGASSPAGRVYLTEVARVLGQVRLLGLGERYPEVRADLLAAVAAAIGSLQLDAARLGAAVDARAMGMPI